MRIALNGSSHVVFTPYGAAAAEWSQAPISCRLGTPASHVSTSALGLRVARFCTLQVKRVRRVRAVMSGVRAVSGGLSARARSVRRLRLDPNPGGSVAILL